MSVFHVIQRETEPAPQDQDEHPLPGADLYVYAESQAALVAEIARVNGVKIGEKKHLRLTLVKVVPGVPATIVADSLRNHLSRFPIAQRMLDRVH